MMQSVQWIERVMLGDLALGLCVIAIAIIGVVMLGGRLPIREGMRIVLGLFVVLGAPVIASGFVGDRGRVAEDPALRPPITPQAELGRPELPLANFDPYAGASLRED